MKCEKCGKDMKKGFMGSDSHIIFTNKKSKFIPKNYVTIARGKTGVHHVYVDSYVCFDCKIGGFTFD